MKSKRWFSSRYMVSVKRKWFNAWDVAHNHGAYFDTWEEARDHAIKRCEQMVVKAEKELRSAQRSLLRARKLTVPDQVDETTQAEAVP